MADGTSGGARRRRTTKQPPAIDEPLRGNAPMPPRRTLAGVSSDLSQDWIALHVALSTVETAGKTGGALAGALWRRVHQGIIPCSCERLTYQRHDNGQTEAIAWPDARANLGAQLFEVRAAPLSGFEFDPVSSDARWNDLVGGVHVMALGVAVPRSAVESLATSLHSNRAHDAGVPPTLPMRARGRRQVFDWTRATAALQNADGMHDLIGPVVAGSKSQGTLCDWLEQWFVQHANGDWDRAPGRSQLNLYAAKIVQARRESDAHQSGK